MPGTWKNSDYAWGPVAKGFHWLLALLILGQLVLGKMAERSPLSPLKLDLFIWHKSIGLGILVLVTLRLIWRLANTTPAAPAGIASRETLLARGGHTLMYLLMFVVPLSGWWISDTSRIPFKAFWIVPLPDLLPVDRSMQELAEVAHDLLTALLLAVVIVHIAAALRHHFYLKNDILRRMLPVRRSPE